MNGQSDRSPNRKDICRRTQEKCQTGHIKVESIRRSEVSGTLGVKKCTCRESNPGLIRGRDTSYHLTTSAHSYYHRDHLSWAQASNPSHQKWRSGVSGRQKGEENLLGGTWTSSVIKRRHIRTSTGHLQDKVSCVSLKEKSW